MKGSILTLLLAACAVLLHAASVHAQSMPDGRVAYCGPNTNAQTCGPAMAPGRGNSCSQGGCHSQNPLNDTQGRVMRGAGSVSAILGSRDQGMQAILSLYSQDELQAIADWLLSLLGGGGGGPPACTLSASNPTPQTGTSITLTAACTNSPTAYTWTNCSSTTSACTTSQATTGTVVYSVRASNASGTSAPASTTVQWIAPGTPPPPPTPDTIQIIEYYNTTLDHYFLSLPAEAAAIDGGSAGPGWRRTGYAFLIEAVPTQSEARPMCRFYGSVSPGPNSHFYTLDPGECEFLKQLQARTPADQPRWNYEGIAFLTVPASNGRCDNPLYRVPVSRAYNNGFARGKDSNHRYGTRSEVTTEMTGRGWLPEGVVFCVLADQFTPP